MSTQGKLYSILYPGFKLPVESVPGLEVRVYPLGFTHLKKYADRLGRLAAVASQIEIPKSIPRNEQPAVLLRALAPHLVKEVVEVVEECIVFPMAVTQNEKLMRFTHPNDPVKDDPEFDCYQVTMSDLSHEAVPEIVGAWVKASFSSKKHYGPWLDMVQNLLNRATGQQFNIMETISSYLSAMGSLFKRSFTKLNQDLRTAVGRIHSTGSGSPPADEEKQESDSNESDPSNQRS